MIIPEANGSTGATLREMVYLEGMPLSAIDVAASPKKIYAVHVDHLNRPVMLTDAAKAIPPRDLPPQIDESLTSV